MNLFMLTAPYQILNALEAIHYFNFTDNHLRIVDTGHFTRAQFEIVIDPADWSSVRFHNFRYKLTHLDFGQKRPENLREHTLELYLIFTQFLHRLRANRIAKSIDPIDNLILGNYRREYDRHMRHFANRISYNALFLLDVGTDTLRIARDRALDFEPQAVRTEVAPKRVCKRIKYAIRRALSDWDTKGAPALTFFTVYEMVTYCNDRLVRNEYAFLKTMMAGAAASDHVFFVGQPLLDQGYITRETFSNCIAWVKQYYAGQRMVYVPHPRESERQLDIVKAAGLEVKRFTAPFEHAIAFSGQRPRCIAAFFSSVVENSASIFGKILSIQAFRLPESVLLKDQEGVARVYARFEKNQQSKIDVVDILEPPKNSETENVSFSAQVSAGVHEHHVICRAIHQCRESGTSTCGKGIHVQNNR